MILPEGAETVPAENEQIVEVTDSRDAVPNTYLPDSSSNDASHPIAAPDPDSSFLSGANITIPAPSHSPPLPPMPPPHSGAPPPPASENLVALDEDVILTEEA